MNVKTRRPSKHANKSRQTWSWEKKRSEYTYRCRNILYIYDKYTTKESEENVFLAHIRRIYTVNALNWHSDYFRHVGFSQSGGSVMRRRGGSSVQQNSRGERVTRL